MQSKNVNELIEKVFERKKIFNQEYDDSQHFKDLRWQEVLEGFLFESKELK